MRRAQRPSLCAAGRGALFRRPPAARTSKERVTAWRSNLRIRARHVLSSRARYSRRARSRVLARRVRRRPTRALAPAARWADPSRRACPCCTHEEVQRTVTGECRALPMAPARECRRRVGSGRAAAGPSRPPRPLEAGAPRGSKSKVRSAFELLCCCHCLSSATLFADSRQHRAPTDHRGADTPHHPARARTPSPAADSADRALP